MSANRQATIGRRWGQFKPSQRGHFRPSFPQLQRPPSLSKERQDFSWRTSMPSSAIRRASRERGLGVALEPALEFADGDEFPAAAAHDSAPPARCTPPRSPTTRLTPRTASSTFRAIRNFAALRLATSRSYTTVATLLPDPLSGTTPLISHPAATRSSSPPLAPLKHPLRTAPPAPPRPVPQHHYWGGGSDHTHPQCFSYGGGVWSDPPPPTPTHPQSQESGGAGKRRRTGQRTPGRTGPATTAREAPRPSHGTHTGHNPPDSAGSSRTRPDENGSTEPNPAHAEIRG